MLRLYLTLLGGFQARRGSGDAVALPTRKAQALLAYLALPVGRAHPRDKLAAFLWGGIRDESARASLRQALFSLRRALGEDASAVLRQDGDLVALDPAVDVDVADFERAVAAGTTESLARAAETYRGDLLAGLTVDEPPSRSGCSASASGCASWRWRGWRSCWPSSAEPALSRLRYRRR